ncbi:hypothetical protein [Sorangium sp. So ce1335]|uniref:hypothetical protein n=1 Tax=Sorangium sp. So ce1335 TaxID=3133335 RepID=UPI003F5D9DA1
MNRQDAEDAKKKTEVLASLASWRFEILLVSGGFNPFVALRALDEEARGLVADVVACRGGLAHGSPEVAP